MNFLFFYITECMVCCISIELIHASMETIDFFTEWKILYFIVYNTQGLIQNININTEIYTIYNIHNAILYRITCLKKNDFRETIISYSD